MRAAVIERFGPPDVLQVRDLPEPSPAPGEVLVRVHAAGVNPIDWFTRAGTGVPVPAFPAVLGWDIAGTVVEAGPGLPAGTSVFGLGRFPALAGGYAEYATVPAGELAVKPDTVDYVTAAAAPMVALTAWQSVFTHGRVAAGQRVLVHGAAGGVGHIAVQLAASTGAHVIGTASARNHDVVAGLGAAEVIDYATAPVEAAVLDADVAIDPIGGETARRLLDTLRPGGVLVTLKGRDPDLERAADAAGRRLAYTYVAPAGATLAQLAEWLAGGRLRVRVDQVLPLDRAAEAHARGERGGLRGRLVLDTR